MLIFLLEPSFLDRPLMDLGVDWGDRAEEMRRQGEGDGSFGKIGWIKVKVEKGNKQWSNKISERIVKKADRKLWQCELLHPIFNQTRCEHKIRNFCCCFYSQLVIFCLFVCCCFLF